jgi:hypothetical protein
MPAGPPPLSAFSHAERRLVRRLRTPRLVQRFLNALPYNTEPPPGGPTLRSFRGVARTGTAHCLEAAVSAAVILEQHGYAPLLLSFESIDQLDHVLFVYRERGRWGSVARSRDPGLHGRKPVFRTARDLARSYFDPYVDFTGRITGFAVADLRDLGEYDWRLSERNVWKVERFLLDYPHRPIHPSESPRSTPDGRSGRSYRSSSAVRSENGELTLRSGPSSDSQFDVLNWPFSRLAQSRSNSLFGGGPTGSVLAWRRASSNRLDNASPRVFSASTD